MNTGSHIPAATAIYQEAQQRFSECDDPAHGWEHVQRVHSLAVQIAREEGANIFIVETAALLHDIGRVVNKKGRSHAEISVEEASKLLDYYGVDRELSGAILHAIEAHSFSWGIEPRTLEAGIVRDADRLDGLGAIGILRWAITGAIKRKTYTRSYHPEDPFAEQHQLDDQQYMLDHFYTKLLKLEDGMCTKTGRLLARQRTAYMRDYLREFRAELGL